jgi:hypothetical protein
VPHRPSRGLRAGASGSGAPRGGSPGLSWGLVALRGLGPGRPRAVIGSARPVRRLHAPRGFGDRDFPRDRSRGEAPLALSRPFRGCLAAAPQRPVVRSRRQPAGRPGGRCFLSWAFVPYDTCQTDGPARWAAVPAATRVPRPGFGYPPRDVHHRSYRRQGAGASVGFSLQGLPLDAVGAPLGVPALLTFPRLRSPEGAVPAAAFRASFSRRVRAVADVREARRPSMPSWGSPLQSVLPLRPGDALVVALPPLSPLRDSTSSATRVSGSLVSGGIGLARLRAAGSPGVSHLLTVTALRSSLRRAGSWIHLTPDGAHYARRRTILAPSNAMQSWILGPRPGAAACRCAVEHLVPLVSACLS